MTSRTVPAAGQQDLLSWEPPVPIERFDRERVRAATVTGKVKRAIAETLRQQTDGGWNREAITVAMADYLGEPVAKSALDAWASEAREGQLPSIVRFMALLHATLDQRLLQVIAEQFGWAVVDKKWLSLIELASLREHKDAVDRRAALLRATARAAGAL